MIRKPAQLAGLRFQNHPETGISLDAVLQDDAVSDPTALPLLEFALTELWNQRSPDGLLTFEALRENGPDDWRYRGARRESNRADVDGHSGAHPSTLRALSNCFRTPNLSLPLPR